MMARMMTLIITVVKIKTETKGNVGKDGEDNQE